MDAAATLEMPTIERKPWWFTPERAREMQVKAEAAKKLRRERLTSEAAAGRTATPEQQALASQMRRILELMEKTDDAGELSQLSSAYDKQFKAWQVLTGTPNPGQRRRGRGDDRPAPPTVQRSPITTPQEKTN
jgi:hypothetical protein